ncbi:MAG: 30S ribosomal protein S7 [Alphaproteobacteria bacterium]|nr:30S ribosomal protein S7 [Alphaproteobacteria bacterium]
MSRRHRAEKREILPDPRFGDLILAKFVNQLMLDGKKSVAEKIVYGALELIRQKEKLKDDQAVLDFFHEAIAKVKPQLEVRSRRVGGATYQVPMEVRPERRLSLALRWIIEAARKRSEHTMVERLAGELIDIMNDRGTAVKKRDDTHKMAEANKAFAHYRW